MKITGPVRRLRRAYSEPGDRVRPNARQEHAGGMRTGDASSFTSTDLENRDTELKPKVVYL